MNSDMLREIESLAGIIGKLLAGKGQFVQAAVLAELTATWRAGHIVPGDARQTDKLRTSVFESHCEAVARLVAHADIERGRRLSEAARTATPPKRGAP